MKIAKRNKITLNSVIARKTGFFNETEITFYHNNNLGIYTILKDNETKEEYHIITTLFHTYGNTNIESLTLPDTDFIQAFNKYFNYQLPE